MDDFCPFDFQFIFRRAKIVTELAVTEDIYSTYSSDGGTVGLYSACPNFDSDSGPNCGICAWNMNNALYDVFRNKLPTYYWDGEM